MNPWTPRVRWLALLLGVVPAAFGWFIVIAEAAAGEEGDGEGVAVGLSFAFLTASAIAAWRWERLGALAEIVAAVVFGIVVYTTAGHNRVPIALILPSPWFLSGVLLLAISSVGRTAKRQQE
jgi:hypothetical protein